MLICFSTPLEDPTNKKKRIKLIKVASFIDVFRKNLIKGLNIPQHSVLKIKKLHLQIQVNLI